MFEIAPPKPNVFGARNVGATVNQEQLLVKSSGFLDHSLDFQCKGSLMQATIVLMNLKAQLKFYIDYRNTTAAELSRKSGVSKQVISLWLSGSKPKNIDQVKKVATALGTTIDNLVFGSGRGDDSKAIDIESILGDGWITGLFEVRMRRVKKPKEG
jgi:transcriptional regulator with XRE-family HTH domain